MKNSLSVIMILITFHVVCNISNAWEPRHDKESIVDLYENKEIYKARGLAMSRFYKKIANVYREINDYRSAILSLRAAMKISTGASYQEILYHKNKEISPGPDSYEFIRSHLKIIDEAAEHSKTISGQRTYNTKEIEDTLKYWRAELIVNLLQLLPYIQRIEIQTKEASFLVEMGHEPKVNVGPE